jgi:hypothetical protein
MRVRVPDVRRPDSGISRCATNGVLDEDEEKTTDDVDYEEGEDVVA